MSNDTNTKNGETVNTPNTPIPPLPDPQMTLRSVFKQSARTDMLVFSFQFLMVEVTAIAVIPDEGSDGAPVYLKFKMRKTP